MTRTTGPDCAVMCNLINTHTHTAGGVGGVDMEGGVFHALQQYPGWSAATQGIMYPISSVAILLIL